LFTGEQLTDLRIGVVHVAGNDGVFRADHHAGRLQSNIYPVGAVVAFGRSMRIRVDVQRVVRTSLHAGFATDAAVFVEINDAVFADEQGFHRTNFHTGRIGAVVAPKYGKQPPGIRKLPFFHLFYISPEDADRHLVLAFAGSGTGVAPDALTVVNDKSVFHII
jgi:hypothetical protein